MREFFKPLRRKLGVCTLPLACVAYALAVWTPDSTTKLSNASAMKQAILAHVPIGTEVELATQFMERENFQCKVYANSVFTGDGATREAIDFVFCCRTDSAAFMEIREWAVALVFADGKVTGILARSAVLGL